MGWDTEIIIIAEGIESKETSLRIAEQIFDKDSKGWGKEAYYVARVNSNYSIYYTYERRKYTPYWAIQEISKVYPSVDFTVLGDMLDFLCGPGGIIRMKNGQIIDSYGIYGENSMRHKALGSPVKEMHNIFNWFKYGGKEEEIRNEFSEEFPFGWCEGNYSEKIIPIDEDEIKFPFENGKEEKKQLNWEKQPTFKVVPTLENYSKSLMETPQNNMKITEKSFIGFIEFNSIIGEIDNEAIKLLDGEIYETGHLHLYNTTFGQHSQDRFFLEEEFKTIQDIEDTLKKYQEEIIKWGLNKLSKKENIKIGKGFSFKWLVHLLKEKRVANKG